MIHSTTQQKEENKFEADSFEYEYEYRKRRRHRTHRCREFIRPVEKAKSEFSVRPKSETHFSEEKSEVTNLKSDLEQDIPKFDVKNSNTRAEASNLLQWVLKRIKSNQQK